MSVLHLAHWVAMVTRPDPAGSMLCQLIKNEGGVAIHFPTIAFVQADLDRFHAALSHLNEQDWLIFISPQAVYASKDAILKVWNHASTINIAAVGAGTAAALQQAGFKVNAFPSADFSSEGLLTLPDFQHVSAKKIMVVRGEGGREMIDTVLNRRGAQVLPLIAYARTLPKVDVNHALDLLRQHKLDVIICGSYESVRNLKVLLGDVGWPVIQAVPLLVMSERIKMLAEGLGFQTIWVAKNASPGAIMDRLRKQNA